MVAELSVLRSSRLTSTDVLAGGLRSIYIVSVVVTAALHNLALSVIAAHVYQKRRPLNLARGGTLEILPSTAPANHAESG